MTSLFDGVEFLLREARRMTAQYSEQQRRERMAQMEDFSDWLEGKDPATGKRRIMRWDTKANNSAPSGAYHRDRNKIQKQIIQEVLNEQGYDKKEAARIAFMIAGMTASGKTTTLRKLFLPDNPDMSVLDRLVSSDPDAIKQKLWEYGLGPDPEEIRQAYYQDTGIDLGSLTPGELASVVHEESSDIAKMITSQAIRDGKGILMDNTLSKPGAGQKRVNKLRNLSEPYALYSGLVDIPSGASTYFAGKRYLDARELWDEKGGTLPPGMRRPTRGNIRGQMSDEERRIYNAQFDSRYVPPSYTRASAPKTPGNLSMATEVWKDEVEPYSVASYHITPDIQGDPSQETWERGKNARIKARLAPGPQSMTGAPMSPSAPVILPVMARRRTAMDQPPQDMHEAFEAFGQGQLSYEDLLYAVGTLPPPVWETDGTRDDYPDVFAYVEANPFARPDVESDILALMLSGAIDDDQADDLYDAVYANPNTADMDPDAELGF